ncbi:hypothetical protein JCM10450v2_000186 [Rhodotorula kratochvilovae]
MHRRVSYDDPSATRFRPRQSSYLRISPTAVLQMTLYLEPAHVEWMSNSVLERMLFALKDRIPLKLRQEDEARAKTVKGAKERVQVDVFRGADYQMAFFFRTANDKHVVLLKDKHVHYTTRSPTASRGAATTRTPSVAPPSRKRARSTTAAAAGAAEEDVLSSGSDGEGDRTAAPAAKRRAGTAAVGAADEDDDELVVVKPEPDEDGAMPPGWADAPSGTGEDGVRLGEVKEEIDDDVKPQVTVSYRGYNIFGRTLVVIVEPYPPLDPADLARPRLLATEVRQLSASVAPESYRGGRSTALRGISLSVTPAPRAPGKGALFRSETTPAESVRGSVAPSELGDGEEDEQMRRLRETSMLLANEMDEDEDLPSLDALVERARGRGDAEGAPLELDKDEPEGTT